MKGNNTITINKATMLEALQLWVESEFKKPARVLDVNESRNDDTFEVELSEPDEAEAQS